MKGSVLLPGLSTNYDKSPTASKSSTKKTPEGLYLTIRLNITLFLLQFMTVPQILFELIMPKNQIDKSNIPECWRLGTKIDYLKIRIINTRSQSPASFFKLKGFRHSGEDLLGSS
jgi:hypothetical protein